YQGAPGLERGIEPLVRIDCDRIRITQRTQIVRCLRRGHCEATVGTVHVEPYIEGFAQGRNVRQRIDSAGADCASGAHDDERDIPPAAASESIWRRNAATSMRRSASVGIQRMEAVPRPARSAAF